MSKPRPFTTDYGISKGHCLTRESALIAAFRQLVIQRLSHVTVEGPDGVVARMRLNAFGVHLQTVDRMPSAAKAQLRRIA